MSSQARRLVLGQGGKGGELRASEGRAAGHAGRPAATADTSWAFAIRTARARRVWSVKRLALELIGEARATGQRPAGLESLVRTIRRWERGDNEPDEVHRWLLARVLGMPAGEAAGEPDQAVAEEGDDPVLRAVDRVRRLEGAPGAETLDCLEELVSDLGLACARMPARPLHVRADRLLGYVERLVAEELAGDHLRLGRRLAGWLAGLQAHLELELGDIAAARASCHAALAYGRRAGDARLMAWAGDRHSKVAFYAGDVRHALRLAEAGEAIAPRSTGVRVGLLGAVARARARLGDRAGAMALLPDIEREYDALPDTEIGGGLFRICEMYPPAGVSQATVWLDELSDVTTASAQQLVDFLRGARSASRRPTRLAMAQVDLATARLQRGRPDEACHFASLALGTERMASSVLMRVEELVAALDGRWPDVVEVRELRERSRRATPS